jgi:hypothetical protein
MGLGMSTEQPEFEHYRITELPSSGPQPRSKASAHNRAMTGSITQAPRPEQRDIDGTVIGGEGQEPHGWTQKYEDENGCLAVALDCGKCFTNVPRRDVLNGNYDTTCTTSHRNRDGNVIYADFTNKTGLQS